MGNEAILYLGIVDLFSDEGEGDVWPETVRLSDPTICGKTGISPGTLDKFRKVLVSRGLIQFQGSGKGYRSGGEYRLINTYSSPKRTPTSSPKRTSNSEELPKRTLEIEELSAKEPQEVPQIEPQKEPQNLGNSHIYIESKQSNLQTPNFSLAAAAREEIGLTSEEEKKGLAPNPHSARPLSPPPKSIPIPAGKTYGDGILQVDVLAYYRDYPDQFPLSIYLPFLRYWTQIFQKGKPDLMGSERWRTMDTWDLETRLDNWNKKELKYAETDKNNGSQPNTPSLGTGNDDSGQGEIIRTQYTKQSFGRSHSPKPGISNA
ncbi:hypothetical protein [Spirosoma spitsbergense]|uniref:hypothetical protein n=1 Tax=Spirosoma spitsbergense TaxID=431554 RepID=UPI00146A520F|nr:hypothetical protein [Spirosoma spitsbergense]